MKETLKALTSEAGLANLNVDEALTLIESVIHEIGNERLRGKLKEYLLPLKYPELKTLLEGVQNERRRNTPKSNVPAKSPLVRRGKPSAVKTSERTLP